MTLDTIFHAAGVVKHGVIPGPNAIEGSADSAKLANKKQTHYLSFMARYVMKTHSEVKMSQRRHDSELLSVILSSGMPQNASVKMRAK